MNNKSIVLLRLLWVHFQLIVYLVFHCEGILRNTDKWVGLYYYEPTPSSNILSILLREVYGLFVHYILIVLSMYIILYIINVHITLPVQ